MLLPQLAINQRLTDCVQQTATDFYKSDNQKGGQIERDQPNKQLHPSLVGINS